MDMLSEDERATLTWMVRHKRRWPLVAMCWLGLAYAIAATIIARNWRRAEAAQVESSAGVLALAPPPLPDERNAAGSWLAVQEAFVQFRPDTAVAVDPSGLRGDGAHLTASRVDPLFTKDWRADPTWAPGSDVRKRLAENRQALADALAAAGLEEVRWDIAYASALPEYPHTNAIRTGVRLLRAHALEASHDGDWDAFLAADRALLRAIAHGQRPAGILPLLLGRSFRAILLDTLIDGVAVARWELTSLRLRTLGDLARASGVGEQPVSTALAADRAHSLMLIDGMGCGHPSSGFAALDVAVPEALSWYSLVYGVDRELYGRMVNALIVREQARERGAPLGDDDFERNCMVRCRAAPFLYPCTGLLFPSLRVIGHDARMQARQALVEFALSACEHRLGSGSWPPATAAGPDPFARDGASFRCRIDAHGDLELRSVGRNGTIDVDDAVIGRHGDDIVYVVHCGVAP